VASDAATADALATALVVLGADDGAEILARFPDVSVTWRE
jgi:thiamine biosynthesis lipoprotein ApbE